MGRIGGAVLLVLLTGCGSTAGGSAAPVPVTAAEPVMTTTSAPITSTTSTPIRVTSTTARPATTATTATRVPTTSVAATRGHVPTTVPVTTAPRPPATVGGGCDPNYSGACVPRGPDIDCPQISAKRFQVVGVDIYRLDGDGDGIACEGPPGA